LSGIDNIWVLPYNHSMVTGISVFVSLAYAVRETLLGTPRVFWRVRLLCIPSTGHRAPMGELRSR